jgi:hypothetical protein
LNDFLYFLSEHTFWASGFQALFVNRGREEYFETTLAQTFDALKDELDKAASARAKADACFNISKKYADGLKIDSALYFAGFCRGAWAEMPLPIRPFPDQPTFETASYFQNL